MMLLFGLAHVFLYINFRLLCKPRWWQQALVTLWLVCATFSWPSLNLFNTSNTLDVLIHWVFTSWMGFSSFFCLLLGIVDIFWVLLLPGRSYERSKSLIRKLAACAFLIAVSISVYSIYIAHAPSIVRVPIRTALLAPDAQPVRIAFLPDMHLSLTHGSWAIQSIVAKVEELQPDIIILGGDVIEDGSDVYAPEQALLRSMTAPYGKYAVTGNHEYWNNNSTLPFIEKAGFQLLHGKAVTVAGIRIVGVDDPLFDSNFGHEASALPSLSELPHDRFTVLAKHRPNVAAQEIGLFDLQLSGHSHGGQIWPVGHLLAQYLMHAPDPGLHSYGSSQLYLSRGVGYYLVPMRFLASPEITLIELIPEQEAGASAQN